MFNGRFVCRLAGVGPQPSLSSAYPSFVSSMTIHIGLVNFFFFFFNCFNSKFCLTPRPCSIKLDCGR
jgi:hypothetical protein